jgi:phosphopantothenoylcysteine decarboxylase/phosphopantothenate--cysteine ligase
MGYALATAAARRGARTILISGPTRLEPPADVEFISVRSSEQMQRAVLEQLPQTTVVIMAAAVADFRPVAVHPTKIKRGNGRIPLELESTPDILADVARAGRGPHGRILVGFAAETDHVAEHARAKLESKHADLIVANDVTAEGAGFDHDTNVITLYSRDGSETPFPRMSKAEAAQRILDRVLELRRTGRQVPATHSGR